MNRENLQRMADYIRTIPQKRFHMARWRSHGDYIEKECKSIGCVIGHCVLLDPRPLSEITKGGIEIQFAEWGEQFTGLSIIDRSWVWMFDSCWERVDNTPEGAAMRIEWLLKNGVPDDLFDQMMGYVPLCYRKNNPKKQ